MAQDKPSEVILKKTFAAFGDIRMVDIPMLDPYRHKVPKQQLAWKDRLLAPHFQTH